MKTHHLDLAIKSQGDPMTGNKADHEPSYPTFAFSHDTEHDMPTGDFEVKGMARLLEHRRPAKKGDQHHYVVQMKGMHLPKKPMRPKHSNETTEQIVDKAMAKAGGKRALADDDMEDDL